MKDSKNTSAECAVVKERPILFSGAMVRAILAGRKTQTRRVVKMSSAQCFVLSAQSEAKVSRPVKGACGLDLIDGQFISCPYGKPGDRLWVREEHFMHGYWVEVQGLLTKGGKHKWRFVPDLPDEVVFDARILNGHFRSGVMKTKGKASTSGWHKRLARFMPRKLSRITLEIVSVRVERLQEISEGDAMAEGIQKEWCDDGEMPGRYLYFSDVDRPQIGHSTPVLAYAKLWQSINGPESWALNPWVWVVEFKRL